MTASDPGASWSVVRAAISVIIAALNAAIGVFNVFLNGGFLGQLAADAYNHSIPFLTSGRIDAVIAAGLIALVGIGFALSGLGVRTRWLAALGVAANIAAISVVVAVFVSGVEGGQ